MTLFKTAVGNFEAKNYQECANSLVKYLGLIGKPELIECWGCKASFLIKSDEDLIDIDVINEDKFSITENKPYLPEYPVSYKKDIVFSVIW